MTKNTLKRILLCGALLSLLFVGGVYLLFAYTAHDTAVVVFDGERFIPQELVIKEGETVSFKNESDVPFWPASNLHPFHTALPTFDPKEPIQAQEVWKFTFETPGMWEYHDHIKPNVTAVVVVENKDGQVPKLDCTIQSNYSACWEKEILDVLKKDGLSAAFLRLSSLFDSNGEFRQACHNITHSLGKEAYALYESGEHIAFTDAVTYCGYGFFHGFIESLIAQSGSLDEARVFCSEFGERNDVYAIKACYHGIGHGVLDGSDPRTWGNPLAMVTPALKVCSKVTPDADMVHECSVGVFNSIADLAAEKKFNLDIKREHAYDLCTMVDSTFKSGCYEQMNVITGFSEDRSLAEAFDVLSTITETEYLRDAVRLIAGSYAKSWLDSTDYGEIIQSCHTLPQELQSYCVQGFVTRLMDFGPRGNEYMIAADFCSSTALREPEKEQCVQDALAIATESVPHGQKEERCAFLAAHTGVTVDCDFTAAVLTEETH